MSLARTMKEDELRRLKLEEETLRKIMEQMNVKLRQLKEEKKYLVAKRDAPNSNIAYEITGHGTQLYEHRPPETHCKQEYDYQIPETVDPVSVPNNEQNATFNGLFTQQCEYPPPEPPALIPIEVQTLQNEHATCNNIGSLVDFNVEHPLPPEMGNDDVYFDDLLQL